MGAAAQQNSVQGNTVGLSAMANASIPNGWNGIRLSGAATHNLIGGVAPGAGNRSGGNAGNGVALDGAANDNTIQGNFLGVGLAVGGSEIVIPNSDAGIALAGVNGTRIGGTSTGAGNVIAGNRTQGVRIAGGSTSNRVEGNQIGLLSNGVAPAGNQSFGVYVGSPGNTIGGDDAAAGNWIADNVFGILLSGGDVDGTTISHNHIGLGIGEVVVPNRQHGLVVDNSNAANPSAGVSIKNNVVASNLGIGLLLQGSGVQGVVVRGNFIGTKSDGVTAASNGLTGIRIQQGASGNVIGGVAAGDGNVIGFNAAAGVVVGDATSINNAIRGNSIFASAGLGIDLGMNGTAEPNDAGDSDTGPNSLQNSPTLWFAKAGSTTRIAGTFNGVPNSTLDLDFFANTQGDPSGYGEGERFLGSAVVVTNASGLASFDVVLAAASVEGEFVSATATSSAGSTSEFSRTVHVDEPDPYLLLVTNTNDAGPGSLHQAILDSNAHSGHDRIWFNIPSTFSEIRPQTRLPNITDPVDIDATTQPGYVDRPVVYLNGVDARGVWFGEPIQGLTLAAGNSLVKGLMVGRYKTGIFITGPGGNVVEANDLGTDGVYDDQRGNETNLLILDSPNNLIGGTSAGASNLISSAIGGGGVVIRGSAATGNRLEGNRIGVDRTATYPLGNLYHNVIVDNAPGNFLGGNTPAAGNTIGGSYGAIQVLGAGSIGNVIQGNYVGTNRAEDQALGGQYYGIVVSGAVDTLVGGTTPDAANHIAYSSTAIQVLGGAGNKIQGNRIGVSNDNRPMANASSGIYLASTVDAVVGGTEPGAANLVGNNGFGIYATGTNTGTRIQGNLLGVLGDGITAAANGIGIAVVNASDLTIGGDSVAARNLISGNTTSGISLFFSQDVTITGNYLGTNASGDSAMPNGLGIYVVDSGRIRVGGTTNSERNLISGNGTGILVEGSSQTGNVIQGNFIGVDKTGSLSLRNDSAGITLSNGSNFEIGGATAGAGNVVSGNGGFGIHLQGSSTGNHLQGNLVGTDASGTNAVPNAATGILVRDHSANNVIGGSQPGERNVISGNAAGGLFIQGASTSNVVQGNFLGTDVTGTQPVGNVGFGLQLRTTNNTIGGSLAGEGNVISGNFGAGVSIFETRDSSLVGNIIGADASGIAPLPNTGNGITIVQETRSVQIGGVLPGQGNRIVHNGGHGVQYFDYFGSATGVLLRGNSIDNNGGLGFDLNANNVVDGNDYFDYDDGANRSFNSPVLVSAAA